MAFTSKAIQTIRPDQLYTYNKTDTSVSIVTETVTERLSGSTFTSTSTQFIFEAKYVNITTTLRSRNATTEPWTVTVEVPTISGFMPVNISTATSGTDSSGSGSTIVSTLTDGTVTTIPPPSVPASSDAGAITGIAGPAQANQVVYILEDGKLIPTPLTAVSGLISEVPSLSSSGSESASASPMPSDAVVVETTMHNDPYTEKTEAELVQAMHDAVNQAGSAVSATSSSAVHPATTSLVPAVEGPASGPIAATAIPTPTVGVGSSSSANGADMVDLEEEGPEAEEKHEAPTETTITGTTITATRTDDRTLIPVNPATIPKPVTQTKVLEGRAATRIPKAYKGLRGAMSQDATQTNHPYPTMVSCTKSIIRQETIYAPAESGTTFVAIQPVTNYLTTVSTLTTTRTVPDRSPFRTALYVSRSTLTTTTTFEHTHTEMDQITYTSSTTTSSYAACATQNMLGPIGHNESHIVNVYNRGLKASSLFTIGHSGSAEDCCVECQTLDTPCVGSVFRDRTCYLFTDEKNVCEGQGAAAAFWVGRPSEEKSPRRRYKWPEVVLSNGPCGYFYDGGIGW